MELLSADWRMPVMSSPLVNVTGASDFLSSAETMAGMPKNPNERSIQRIELRMTPPHVQIQSLTVSIISRVISRTHDLDNWSQQKFRSTAQRRRNRLLLRG